MKAYNAKDIRNIAIAGHGGRGKTTLAEAMLYTAKATDRLGRVADGTTVLDFDAEEKGHGFNRCCRYRVERREDKYNRHSRSF